MHKIYLSLLLISGLSMPTTSQAEELIGLEITRGAYIGGGITGSILGFGSGHLIQGQTVKGLSFMSAQLASVAIGAIGWAKLNDDGSQAELIFLGTAFFAGLKLYELHDLWSTPQRRGQHYYVPVKEIRIRPEVAYLNRKKLFLGISASMNI